MSSTFLNDVDAMLDQAIRVLTLSLCGVSDT
jgi:hypothetical protein